MKDLETDKATVEQFISYTVGGEEYGIEISKIHEIIRVTSIAGIPHTPPFVAGVVNLRGEIVPIISMREILGYPHAAPTRNSRIVVVGVSGTTVGLLVDAVYHVLSLPESSLLPPPPVLETGNVKFIKGVAKIGSRLIIFIDLEKLIDFKELEVVSKSMNRAVSRPGE
jgi:purine-binding chemotaxis protein CheW